MLPCDFKGCQGEAQIQECRSPHRQFCNKECQALYWLGVTPRLGLDAMLVDTCLAMMGYTKLNFDFTVTIRLDQADRALLDGTDELLGLPRGTLCWPQLQIAYRFPAEYDWLHWLDFDPPTVNRNDDCVTIMLSPPGVEVLLGPTTLLSLALAMSRPYKPRTLDATHDFLAHAIRNRDYGLLKRSYESGSKDALLFHLMQLRYKDLAHAIVLTVGSCMAGRSDTNRYQLNMHSVQDYVAHKLAPLRVLGRSRPAPDTTKDAIMFALPGLTEPQWPLLVNRYLKAQEFTPASYLLEKARSVTIVARSANPGGRILGYAVCKLYGRRPGSTSTSLDIQWVPQLKYFVDANNANIWDYLVIEGLSVDKEWRGGRENSIAVLLVFHVLYFALRCGEDCGLQRVVCQSAARTTALIMRQFGGVFQYPEKALEWMRNRTDEKLSITEDLRAFEEEFPAAGDLLRSDEAATMSDKKRRKMLEAALSKKARSESWLRPRAVLNKITDDHSIDTFLYLGPENRRLHEQMARYERLLGDQVLQKHVRANEDGDDLQGEARRKRHRGIGAVLTQLPMTALDHFL